MGSVVAFQRREETRGDAQGSVSAPDTHARPGLSLLRALCAWTITFILRGCAWFIFFAGLGAYLGA